MVSCNSGISEFCHTSGDVLCAQISHGNNCVFYCNCAVISATLAIQEGGETLADAKNEGPASLVVAALEEDC